MNVPPDGQNDGRQERQVAECEEERVEGRVELRVGGGRLVARPPAVPGKALARRKPATNQVETTKIFIRRHFRFITLAFDIKTKNQSQYGWQVNRF